MYKIDVTKLKNKLEELNKLLETYQENYLNMYYQIEISDEEEYWVDPHARNFFDDNISHICTNLVYLVLGIGKTSLPLKSVLNSPI